MHDRRAGRKQKRRGVALSRFAAAVISWFSARSQTGSPSSLPDMPGNGSLHIVEVCQVEDWGARPEGIVSGMTTKTIAYLNVADRRAWGADARSMTSPSAHAGWVTSADRPDPAPVLEEQNARRDPDLVSVRHGRMTVSLAGAVRTARIPAVEGV
jgi:hypothetical protein